MMRRNKVFGVAGLAAAMIASATAHAQYSPDASAMLGAGMGNLALSSSILSGTRALSKDTEKNDQSDKADTNHPKSVSAPANAPFNREAAMEQAKAKLLPEYKLRLARDGRDSANAWLKEAAYAEGVKAGRAARQQQAE